MRSKADAHSDEAKEAMGDIRRATHDRVESFVRPRSSLSGVFKDVINVPRYRNAKVNFVADDPGLMLFHCRMQHLSCSGMTDSPPPPPNSKSKIRISSKGEICPPFSRKSERSKRSN